MKPIVTPSRHIRIHPYSLTLNNEVNCIRILLFLILSGFTYSSFGQDNTLWLTEEFWETNDSTVAHYKRVVNSVNLDNSTNVTDFLKSGEKYFEGSVVYVNGSLPVNNYKYFYKNGKLKFEGSQTVLTASGYDKYTSKEYFINGQLRCEYEGTKSKLKIIQSFDSLGNNLLNNGNGYALIEDRDYHLFWKGKIKNFKMDSVWKAEDVRTGQLIHSEYYNNGIFIKGITIHNGKTINYNKEIAQISPKFIRKVRSLIKAEIHQQIPKSERLPTYKVAVFFKNGNPVQLLHLRKNLNEEVIDFNNVEIPAYTLIEKGKPIESLTLGLKLIKVE